jgi:hypothetical protein
MLKVPRQNLPVGSKPPKATSSSTKGGQYLTHPGPYQGDLKSSSFVSEF